MKNLLLLLIVAAGLISCKKSSEINQCKRFDALAIEMDQVYKQVLEDYRADQLLVKRIKASQVKWIGYRNSYINSLYTENENSYGANHKECRCKELNDMQEFRINQLSKWVDGSCDGKDCKDSRNSLKK